MQNSFLVQFVYTFNHVFLKHLDGLFTLFSGYAISLFYSIATIELVIVGLLVAASSTASVYTFLLRIIKISLFFFLVFHFSDIFNLLLRSIAFIGTQTVTNISETPNTAYSFKLSSLWDFKNANNYVTQGLLDGLDTLTSNVNNNAPPDLTVPNSSAENKPLLLSNNVQNNNNDLTSLPFIQLLIFALTGILAITNIALFYFAALLAILCLPFGQTSITEKIFQTTFSQFISTGIRLMLFTIIFILFNFFYHKMMLAFPEASTNFHNLQRLPGWTPGGIGANAFSTAHIITLLLSLLGLLLCWIIPRELSQRIKIFTIPTAPKESSTAMTSSPLTLSQPPSSHFQSYHRDLAHTPATIASATPSSHISSATPNIAINSTTTSSTGEKTHAPTVTTVNTKLTSSKNNVKNSDHETLKQQTRFTHAQFSQERASVLRKNFRDTMEKNKK